jgi:TPR repeat protein
MRKLAATLAVIALLFSVGSAWADYDDGKAAYDRGDYATAIKEWRPLAEQGDANAQINLGDIYLLAYGGGPTDKARVAEEVDRACREIGF